MATKSRSTGGAPLLPASKEPLIRISFFFSKLPNVSYPEFYEYWRSTHGRLTVASNAFATSNVQRYVQMRNNPELAKQLEPLGITIMKDFEWDACSEIYVRNIEDYLKFATSEEAAKVLGPDGANIVDPAKGVRVTVSMEDPLFLKSRL